MNKIDRKSISKTSVFRKASLDSGERLTFKQFFRKFFAKLTEFCGKLIKLLFIFGILSLLYFIVITIFIGYLNVYNFIWVFIGIICLIIYKKILKLYSKIPKFIKVLFLVFIIVFSFSFIIIESQIINHARNRNTEDAYYAILLGAGLNGSNPSLTLLQRINAAVEYLHENKDVKVVVSGGRGTHELYTEAEIMSKLLQTRGIEINRIIVEDSSTNTQENLAYSKNFIDSNRKTIIISSGFHLFRAKSIAKKLGYKNIGGLASKTPLLLLPNYYVREYFAILKELMVNNL